MQSLNLRPDLPGNRVRRMIRLERRVRELESWNKHYRLMARIWADAAAFWKDRYEKGGAECQTGENTTTPSTSEVGISKKGT